VIVTAKSVQVKLLIDGEFKAGEGNLEQILNPATGEIIVQVAEASLDQVRAAVAAASRAFPAWARTTPKDRATLLLKLADAIEVRATEFARLESLNCGKPYLRALNDEIPATADVFRFFAGAWQS
jgi:aminobutyraldehyde dehydrogenase